MNGDVRFGVPAVVAEPTCPRAFLVRGIRPVRQPSRRAPDRASTGIRHGMRSWTHREDGARSPMPMTAGEVAIPHDPPLQLRDAHRRGGLEEEHGADRSDEWAGLLG
jgi:hypothetical protein